MKGLSACHMTSDALGGLKSKGMLTKALSLCEANASLVVTALVYNHFTDCF